MNKAVETLLRRDRWVVLVGLIVVVLLAWLYLGSMVDDGNDMAGMSNMAGMSAMTTFQTWTITTVITTLVMWAVMMVGMMTPSATPIILLYALVYRKQNRDQPFGPTGVFFLGYLTVWLGFSVAATALQWGLENLALLSPMLISISPVLTGIFLIAAGVYQWIPAKSVCLQQCRSPVEYLSRHWRPGINGAFRMGWKHGLYCLGCCWALMLLLFIGGVMNLVWVAVLAVLVLVEKTAPFGRAVGRITSIALIGLGIASLVSPLP